MLSYQHAYHAGNHADILKHLSLSLISGYLVQKDKPFSYLESHAGAGLYRIDSEEARTTGEAEKGLLRILDREDAPSVLKPYLQCCRTLCTKALMPGSGEIVRSFSRPQDRLSLMEKHPQEIKALEGALGAYRNVRVLYRDGWEGLVALTPPSIRRGFCLVDPSYEEPADFNRAAQVLEAVARRWNVGILCLWYPLVSRRSQELAALKIALESIGGEGLCAELCVRPLNSEATGFGLYGSGMIILRPPWKLGEELSMALPWLARALEESSGEGAWSLRTW